MPSDLLALTLSLTKMVIKSGDAVDKQATVVKLLLSRILPLVSCTDVYRPLQTAVLELFRTVLQLGREDLLGGAEIVDLGLPFLNLV